MVIFNSYVSHYQRVTMIIRLMKPWSSNCFRPSYWDRQVARVTRPSGHGIFRASNGHRMEALHGKSICQMDENWEYIYIIPHIFGNQSINIYIYLLIQNIFAPFFSWRCIVVVFFFGGFWRRTRPRSPNEGWRSGAKLAKNPGGQGGLKGWNLCTNHPQFLVV